MPKARQELDNVILIIDFGSQYNQLIARRVREHPGRGVGDDPSLVAPAHRRIVPFLRRAGAGMYTLSVLERRWRTGRKPAIASLQAHLTPLESVRV